MSRQDNRNQRPGSSNSGDEGWTLSIFPACFSITNSKKGPSETASTDRSPNANFDPTAATEEEVEIQYSNDAIGYNQSPWRLFHVLSCTNQTTISDTSSTSEEEEGNSDTESVDFFTGYINSMESFLAASQEKTIQKYKRKIPPKVERVTMAGISTDLDTSMETSDTDDHSDESVTQVESVEKVELSERKYNRKILPKVERVTVARISTDIYTSMETIDTDAPYDEFVTQVETVKKVELSERKRKDKRKSKKEKKVQKQPHKKKMEEPDGRKKRGLWWKILGLIGLSIAIYLISDFASKSSSDKDVNYSSSPEDSENTPAENTPAEPVADVSTENPTENPTESPSSAPSEAPSAPPSLILVTYVPGKLTVRENGLRLSEGLQSKIIARAGERVELTGLSNSQVSEEVFHMRPDGAGVFEHPETGGWAYVSNSEVLETGGGGVGALYFDKDGQVMDYRMLLQNTTHNCAGGKTPWNTWVSCEEFGRGSVFQVDPFGLRPPQETTLGMMRTGAYESFASDIRNEEQPRFFVTEDAEGGAMRRFTPDDPTWDDPWNILHTNGTIDYLVLNPEDEKGGTYTWTTDFQAARTSATLYYQHTEGIDVSGNELFVVSKNQKELFILDLDAMTYQVHSTISGVFDGMPDQMQRLVHGSYDLLYFCEEGGPENGVHARDTNGWFFTILESAELNDETTGLDFSPDGKHLYVSFQENGLIFDISREDGLPFHGKTLDVKYHELQIQ